MQKINCSQKAHEGILRRVLSGKGEHLFGILQIISKSLFYVFKNNLD